MSAYSLHSGVAHIALDDGKVNALGSASIADLNVQLDRALHDEASAVLLSGREGVFSAGFDLGEVRSGASAVAHLRRELIDLELRLFEFERPVVIACTGHALAAGAALLLAADRRIGMEGAFRLGFNEASIGTSISAATVELARYRMPMPWFESIISGETFSPQSARDAGLLDQVVETTAELAEASQIAAETLSRVPMHVFTEMRHAARGATADRIRQERSRLADES
jgi:enoyl-CoA hydratase/carnithine racemase